MKKFFTAIMIATITSFVTYAQIDVKTLNGMSDEQIRQTFGEPKNYTFDGPDGYCHFYYYPHVTIVQTDQGRALEAFWTDSPDYCILTKYIPGGIKVGDPITKLQAVDFSKVDYGRNNPKNALTFRPNTPENRHNYIVFQEEYYHVSFRVENGIIIKWLFDIYNDYPYIPYDTSIKFW